MINQIKMSTYFCPACGRGMESNEAVKSDEKLSLAGKCPECNVSLQLSGLSFIVLGVLLLLFAGMILCDNGLPVLIIGFIMIVFGVFRIFEQLIIIFKYKKK